MRDGEAAAGLDELEQQFASWFARLGLRHFEAHEVLGPVLEDGRRKWPMPEPLHWDNAIAPLIVLDALREELGEPVVIIAGNRTEEYNAALKGSSPVSQHLAFRAFDFYTRQKVRAYELLLAWQGRIFEAPVEIMPAQRLLSDGKTFVPYKSLQLWDQRGGESTVFRYAGGVGIYPWGLHADSRGYRAKWDFR
ncbi:MAG: D-Ala-D-Ala carboxypeptidase family metallohydrolase [Acidobacteriota bacterium]